MKRVPRELIFHKQVNDYGIFKRKTAINIKDVSFVGNSKNMALKKRFPNYPKWLLVFLMT